MNHGSQTVTRKAPAKLNLSLRVIARRGDGFHEIDTLMVPLPGLHDVLTLEPAVGGTRLSCNDATLPTDGGNLVVRAANAFAEATGIDAGARIHLEKRIPSGAGLGGGSSDAAATLLGLRELHGTALDDDALRELAADIGSDVPFFLQSGPARCTGRGEVVTPVSGPPSTGPLPVLLLKPSFPVATADAYRRALDPGVAAIPGIPMEPSRIDGLTLVNDLERPVFAKHRLLAELKLWLALRAECRAALMSGSGSVVFAVLHPGVDAEALTRAARHELDATLWSWHGEAG